MKKFVYPAIFEKSEDAGNYCACFPDLSVCGTIGDTLEECKQNAAEALALHLTVMLEDGDEIPAASDKDSFDLTGDEQVFLVEATLPDSNEKEVKTFVPIELYAKAEAAGVDFSTAIIRGLQAALQPH